MCEAVKAERAALRKRELAGGSFREAPLDASRYTSGHASAIDVTDDAGPGTSEIAAIQFDSEIDTDDDEMEEEEEE